LSSTQDESSALVRAALAAGSQAVGRQLSSPVKLTGSDRSVVLRCQDSAGGTVVIKTYPQDDDGPASFAAEAAGLTISGGTGLAPELLAASAARLTVVMSDLGSGRSMADALLADSGAAARATLLDWARDCGELSAATTERAAEFETLKSRYLAGRPDEGDAARFSGRILAVGERLAKLAARPGSGLKDVIFPRGLDADLAAVAAAIRASQYPIFTPGDICPDNNLITGGRIRFLDFESADVYSVFLDAAYIRMPFSTCWCVFRLPSELAAEAEAVYRGQVTRVHPELADDATWRAGVRRAVAAWSLRTMSWLLPWSIEEDRPMAPDRVCPGSRQLMRYRLHVLVAELSQAGDLPAIAELAESLLAATEQWHAAEMPLYPAFR
jgi:hypothetical protein